MKKMRLIIETVNENYQVTENRIKVNGEDDLRACCSSLSDDPNVRSARVFKEVFYTRKSFDDAPSADMVQRTESEDDIVLNFYDGHTRLSRIESLYLDALSGNGRSFSIVNMDQFQKDLADIIKLLEIDAAPKTLKSDHYFRVAQEDYKPRPKTHSYQSQGGYIPMEGKCSSDTPPNQGSGGNKRS